MNDYDLFVWIRGEGTDSGYWAFKDTRWAASRARAIEEFKWQYPEMRNTEGKWKVREHHPLDRTAHR